MDASKVFSFFTSVKPGANGVLQSRDFLARSQPSRMEYAKPAMVDRKTWYGKNKPSCTSTYSGSIGKKGSWDSVSVLNTVIFPTKASITWFYALRENLLNNYKDSEVFSTSCISYSPSIAKTEASMMINLLFIKSPDTGRWYMPLYNDEEEVTLVPFNQVYGILNELIGMREEDFFNEVLDLAKDEDKILEKIRDEKSAQAIKAKKDKADDYLIKYVSQVFALKDVSDSGRGRGQVDVLAKAYYRGEITLPDPIGGTLLEVDTDSLEKIFYSTASEEEVAYYENEVKENN